MIEINNICKTYGNKQVLTNLTFEVGSGTICGLLGLNGAGKSTLMKIICSLVFEDSGTIAVNGQTLAKDRTNNSQIGFMIESPAFYPSLTGWQNLSVLASLYPDIKKERIAEVLKLTGMAQLAGYAVKKYSMGMKQRLYFAYALLTSPKVLVLDEPFNGIDPVTVKLFRDLILNLAKEGCTVLISSHMIADIKSFCDKAVIIENGRLVHETVITPDMDLEALFLSKVSSDGAAQ